MKGLFVAVVVSLAVLSSACGGDGSSCALRTEGLSGEGPGCSNSLECGDNEYELSCDANTSECTCLLNGVAEMTIPYEDAFCPDDFGNADFDAHAAAARDACGWP
jgi:hypothetical protein